MNDEMNGWMIIQINEWINEWLNRKINMKYGWTTVKKIMKNRQINTLSNKDSNEWMNE